MPFLKIVLAIFVASPVMGQTAKEIIAKYNSRNALGIKKGVADITMVLQDKKQRVQERNVTLKVFEDKSYRANSIVVNSPANLQNTALLFKTNKSSDAAEMHLYLPSFGKPKRLAAAQKRGKFIGSDFTYADMDGEYLSRSRLKKLGDTKVGGNDCFQVEAYPNKKDSHAYKVLLQIRKDNFIAPVIKYYNKKNELIKAFQATEIKQKGKQWYVKQSQMWDKKANHTTGVMINSIASGKGLKLQDFSPERMKND